MKKVRLESLKNPVSPVLSNDNSAAVVSAIIVIGRVVIRAL